MGQKTEVWYRGSAAPSEALILTYRVMPQNKMPARSRVGSYFLL